MSWDECMDTELQYEIIQQMVLLHLHVKKVSVQTGCTVYWSDLSRLLKEIIPAAIIFILKYFADYSPH